MRKILVGAGIVFVCMLTAGCSSQQTSPSKQSEEEEKPDTFQIATAIHEEGTYSISFPQLIQKQNSGLDMINELIKKEAILFLEQYKDGGSSLSMDYQITFQTDDTVSILYTGDYSGGMYPTHLLFTTNIDLKNERKIELPDVFVIDEQFIETFREASYLDPDNPDSPNVEKQAAVIEYLTSMNTQELTNAFSKADRTNPKENLYGIFSYYTEDSLIISFQVPHALGDHAEFKLKVEDLKKK
ncbi:hypothetical protein [Ferdinandcohnia sp. Marseille-Q9671]